MPRKVLHTTLCDMLGIEYPIILAGMGKVAGVELTAAVSNAGGLGVLGASLMTLDEMRDAICQIRERTDKPFGVDLLLPRMEQLNAFESMMGSGESLSSGKIQSMIKAVLPREHQEYVEKLKEEIGVSEVEISSDESIFGIRMGITLMRPREAIRVLLEERVPVFASGLGNPAFMVDDAHAQGMKVIGLVGNVKNARRMAEAGVDIVVAQGTEGGGHTGRIGTMALVPQVVDAVAPTPVVAAGGIGDGRGVVASLAMGAVGVWVGTAFIATEEAVEENFQKQNIIDAVDEDAVITRLYSGKTTRTIGNKLIDSWDVSKISPLPMPLQTLLINDLQARLMKANKTEYLSGFAGQVSGLVKEVKSAKAVLDDMVEEAIKILAEKLPNEVRVDI